MNEDRDKIRLSKAKQLNKDGWFSAHVKPTGRFWKRYFNKKVRSGMRHKRGNWFEWC